MGNADASWHSFSLSLRSLFGLVYDAVWPSHMGTITGVINCRLGEGVEANLSPDSEIKTKKTSFIFLTDFSSFSSLHDST